MSDNQEIIDNLNLIKQRVNEGSREVRDQRDVALELVKDNEQAVDMLKGTIQQYNRSCRDTKQDVDRLVDLYIPHPIEKLPKEFSYPRLKVDGRRVGVCTCLIPPLLFAHVITDEDFAAFLDWFCKGRYGNQIRCFLQGGWEPYTFDWILKPFNTRPNGKYDVYDYNEEYFALIERRLAMMRERNLTAVTTINDNCSLHNYASGWWGSSWWNGDNNVNGTATHPAGYYHGWEEWNQNEPGWPELAAALTKFYHYLFKRFEGKFGRFHVWEYGNEVYAAQNWHAMHWQIANEYIPADWPHPHFPKFRTQSSVAYIDWYRTKYLEKTCRLSIHACCDADKALQRAAEIGKPDVKYILSQDGCEPTPTPQGMADMAYAVLDAGHRGVEFNLRPTFEYHNGEWKIMRKKTDWTFQGMMNTSQLWFDQVREGWFKYLKQHGVL